MNKPPAFQFYAQDFLTGVMYLTNEEIGIYVKMLAKQWTDGKIPKKRLGLFLGIEWENLSEELKSKFEDKGEYVINKRLEAEREKKSQFLKKQSENGKKGGRGNKSKANLNPNKSQKKPLEVEDEKEVEDELGKKKKENEVTLWPDFEDFWNSYDKKVGKHKAEKKYQSINQSDRELIMNHIEHYKKAQPEKKFRKDPITYLNNKSWNDEIITNEQKNTTGADQEFRDKTAERLNLI